MFEVYSRTFELNSRTETTELWSKIPMNINLTIGKAFDGVQGYSVETYNILLLRNMSIHFCLFLNLLENLQNFSIEVTEIYRLGLTTLTGRYFRPKLLTIFKNDLNS